METTKKQTETYVILKVKGLDPITVYVTNYSAGEGKIVIECYGDAWAHYWPAMGECSLQDFFSSADNDYLLTKLLSETKQTDFEGISEALQERGFDTCVTSDAEIAFCDKEMRECFGADWYMDLPRCHTADYKWLGKIINAIKWAFLDEINPHQATQNINQKG